MKSFDLIIQQQNNPTVSGLRSLKNSRPVLLRVSKRNTYPVQTALYCTVCKKFFIVNENESNEHKCPYCEKNYNIRNSSAVVKSEYDIIRRTDEKLSVYNWQYEPRIVWPKKNKKPSLIRILHVDGKTFGINGCYKWRFSFVNGKKILSKDKNPPSVKTKWNHKCVHKQIVSTLHNTEEKMPIDFLREISPSFAELKLEKYPFPMSKRVFDAARKGTKELIKAILGRNEPSLIKEIAKYISEGKEIWWGQLHFLCRNIKDINVLRNCVQSCVHETTDTHYISVRDRKTRDKNWKTLQKSLSKYFSREKLTKILCSCYVYESYMFTDTINMFVNRLDEDERLSIVKEVNDGKEWSVIRIHDACLRLINKTRDARKQKPFEYDESFKCFEYKKENVKIVLPKSPMDMLAWGQALNNCVYSYADNVRAKKIAILALYVDNELIANIEITPKGKLSSNARQSMCYPTINQFRGKNNEKILDKLENNNTVIKEWMDEHKFLVNQYERTQGEVILIPQQPLLRPIYGH